MTSLLRSDIAQLAPLMVFFVMNDLKETSHNINILEQDIYICPMHVEIQQDHPGICPICGMDLEQKEPKKEVNSFEYEDLWHRFYIGVILTIPILLLSMGKMFPSKNLSYALSGELSGWIQFLFCTPVVLWCGWPFFKKGWYSLRNRSLNMFTLIALGVGTAYFYSALAVLFPDFFPSSFKEKNELFIYFEAASVITVLILLGQLLELKAKSQTTHAIQALLNRAAKNAHLITKGQEHDVSINQVKVGDLLRVKPGEKVPVDGTVTEGSSFVDESMITGEARAIEKKVKASVIGGTINQKGSFLMTAKRVGNETLLARIVQMVSDAQRSKAPIQNLADTVSGYFVPIVILVSVLTFIIWAAIGPEPRFVFALVNSVAVLIIACPCALGLATPMSIMVGIGKGAEGGILIKNAEGLERLEKVTTMILDKTGTLTEGRPTIIQIVACCDWQNISILKLAAAVEQNSEHPLALAIVQGAQQQRIPIPSVEQFESITGSGVTGWVEEKKVFVGSLNLMESNQITGMESLLEQAKEKQKQALTVAFVAVNGKAAGFITIADPIKPTSPHAIKDLHRLGIQVIVLTGDHAATAHAVAKKLNIEKIHAALSPKNKQNFVLKLKEKGEIVAMAGDGINDAPALAAADVGIAMGTGTDVAIESAAVTLVKGDLKGIVSAILLSRATMRNVRQNLFFAFIYNALGIPIAAGLLFPFFGLLLDPILASVAMSFSSLSVILNALRLKNKKLDFNNTNFK